MTARKPVLVSVVALLSLLLVDQPALAQDTIPSALATRYLEVARDKLANSQEMLDKKTSKYLDAFFAKEVRLIKKISRKDSVRGKELLAEAKLKRDQLLSKLNGKVPGLRYSSALDSIRSIGQFLSGGDNGKLSTILYKESENLQGALNKADVVSEFMKERQQKLKSIVAEFPFVAQLKKINKEIYYYNAQVKEIEQVLTDKSRIEDKVFKVLTESTLFKDFMKKNSQLASMFRFNNTGVEGATIPGLQTNSAVRADINRLVESGGQGAQQALTTNLTQASAQIQELKNKMSEFSYSSSDAQMPEGFKPNNQKTKTFFQRIEFGTNFQPIKSTRFLPSMADVAMTVGYKISDKSVVGVGTSLKLDFGTSLDDLDIDAGGYGFRSYLDVQMKGKLFASGGFERSYVSAFATPLESKWQNSGFIGVTTKISAHKKMRITSQLLWNFLSYSQEPRTSPVIFRVGYIFK